MLELIAKNPQIGQEYTTRKGLKIRRMVVNSHLIIYRKAKKRVAILRILHQSMDPDRQL